MKAKDLQELRKQKKIKVTDISAVMSRQTYYNWISGKTDPSGEALTTFLKLFDIDEKTFQRLLKNTIKNFNS